MLGVKLKKGIQREAEMVSPFGIEAASSSEVSDERAWHIPIHIYEPDLHLFDVL